MIRTDSDEYFIEPLERGTQELEDQGRVHVVYRRSAVLQAASDISLDYQGRRSFSQLRVSLGLLRPMMYLIFHLFNLDV